MNPKVCGEMLLGKASLVPEAPKFAVLLDAQRHCRNGHLEIETRGCSGITCWFFNEILEHCPYLDGCEKHLDKSPFLMGKSPFLMGKSTINGQMAWP